MRNPILFFFALLMILCPFGIRAQQLAKSAGVQLRDGKSTAGSSALAENFGAAVAMAGDLAFVGETKGTLDRGSVTVLARNESSGLWEVDAVLHADPGEIGDGFGSSLDADGNRVIVGAPGALAGLGAAYVFERKDDGRWLEDGVLIGDGFPPGRGIGRRAVAISGDLAAIGSDYPGFGFVFERDSTSGEWRGIGTIDSDEPDWIAFKVSLSNGQRLAASAPYANGGEGTVFVAEKDSAGEGVIIGAFTVPGSSKFGQDVALSGDILAVGQLGSGGSGFVFEYDGENWNETHSWDFFTGSLAASGESVIAANTAAGEVTVFRKIDTTWVVDGVLTADGGTDFGTDVDISGDYAIVGAPRSFEPGSGSAFIFERRGDGDWQSVLQRQGEEAVFASISGGRVDCAGGRASLFPCGNVDLVSYVNMQDLMATGERMSDMWGWTDSQTGHEYAIATHTAGVTFVDVTDAENPVVVGLLPIHPGSVPNAWHDVKVYADHAFTVADAAGDAGMQVFDLTQLRSVTSPPVQFEETSHYDGFSSAHNVAINEETATAYVVGGSGGGLTCGGGLHMVDLSNPIEPEFLGCYADPSTGRSGSGYTHDAQCVVYHGPDPDYQGDEICFGSNETAIQITRVTDRAAPATIATATYPGAAYVHQGWLSEDGVYFYQNDELDESPENPFPRTFIWNVEDLDDPVLAATYVGTEAATDHNLWLKDGFMYETNYISGLRILDVSDPETPKEVAFFDPAPALSLSKFEGSWSSYPFFESGNLVLTSAHEGLFVVRPNLNSATAGETEAEIPDGFGLEQNYPNPFHGSTQIRYTVPGSMHVNLSVTDVLGRTVATLVDETIPAGTHTAIWDAEGFAGGTYHYRMEAGEVTLSGWMIAVR